MKKLVLTAALIVCSSSAFAVSLDDKNCERDNTLIEEQSDSPAHDLTATTSTVDITSGTNGCGDTITDVSDLANTLSKEMMEELSKDMAYGNGEALNTIATIIGIEQEDRDQFSATTCEHVNQIFSTADVTSEQVINNLIVVMQNDEQLSKYIAF